MIRSPQELLPVLMEMRDDLRDNVERLRDSQAADGTGYTNHQADDATQAFDQAKDLAIRTSTEKRLRLVEDALTKFKQGTYGTCENCGKEIDIARLEAIPYTPYCLECAEARDYRRR
ncbi:MAG: TraR/DksA C4-type zinc finger protein [Anaerolineae bacterium]|nr:TraR/DksA C4-type zinc finger protein [Anaerolineae bacterium]